MKKLLVVDGNSILNRAFYGTENSFMKNAEGLYTGAVYGFLNILLKYLEEDKPDYVAVAFDVKQPTFRHIAYDEYKKTRKGMPDELAAQFPIAKELLHALEISVIEQPGYEADDIIGTFSNYACRDEIECIILTGDRDSLQLVNECVQVKLPVTRGGKTNTEFYDKDAVFEKYGVTPDQLIDVKALMGDTSDNVPGIPGIGEKTAISLIKEYQTLDNIYLNLDKISKPALKTKLESGKDLAYMSKKLVTICREVPLEVTKEDIIKKDYDPDRLLNILNKLEFRSIIKRLNLSGNNTEVVNDKVEINEKPIEEIYKGIDEMILPEQVVELSGIEDINNYVLPININKAYIVSKFVSNELSEISLRFDNDKTCINISLPGSMFISTFLSKFRMIFENINIKKVMFDAKPLALWLLQNDCVLKGIYFDVAIASYLSDSTRNSNNIPEVYRFFTSKEIKEGRMNELYALKEIEEYAKIRLENDGQTDLFNNVEIPLVSILAEFEYLGFRVNPDILKEAGKDYDKRINELTTIIHDFAGKVFNINSPKQLGEVLFDDLQLEGKKKTKTGYKTNIEVLENLYDVHPIIPCIIEYRQNSKLKSTYIDGLLNAINPMTGRVHSSFNQMITATGRLSSTEPNLQNLPIRSDIGRQIRQAFEPRDKNHILIDADYSQIELRVLAHISQDSTMINAFKNDEDIHTITASKVFNIDPSDVTSNMRSKAKAVNFGIIYGISEYGLSRDLRISFSEAKQIISDYLRKYPGIDAYMKEIVAFASKNGYVTTLMGRRRYLPELQSTKSQIRSFGERIAMNTPIQGTAADIIKIAMVKVYNELKVRELKSSLVLQVHDELLIDALKSEQDEVTKLLKECMENAFELTVPLLVSINSGDNFDFKD